MRNILEAPILRKPKLGQIPSYITDSSLKDNQTNFLLRSLDNQLNKNLNRVNSISKEFLDTYLKNLWNYELNSTSNNLEIFGEELINNLLSYKDLREDYIEFLFKVTKLEFNLDIDLLINFFEKKPIYNRPKDYENNRSYRTSDYEIFEIIFHELFIYTITICLKNSNYKLVDDLLNSGYYFEDIYERNTDSQKYSVIYTYHRNLENYNKLKSNKITGFGDFVISNLSEKINKMDFILADTLCHYISELKKIDSYEGWFPSTYLYKNKSNFDFFKKLTSERHFNKVKGIFNVNEPKELKEKLNNYKTAIESKNSQRASYGSGSFSSIPFVFEVINIDKIATER